ncbi:DoxX family protein [Corallococcus llansteffanensis]|uniref:DoxX family protein n=1 Tax=Corallococcus llansteffanensis TaxID=2316731 RepID=A0A3A8Q6V3_9BACT|nr:DoxX family protein [Corallococcus llansteffanensis]RKH60582.1 DoxX family protein [Corallococcus llansteffanensis]
MSRIESFLSSSSARDAGATVLRIALGAVFLAHAGAKAFVFTFAGTARFFEAHGFPGWTAGPVFLAELLGGLALVAGFRTRLVALGLVPVMLGALKPHVGNGWMFTSAGGGWEYVAFLLLALVAQALVGSGALALDGARERRPASTGRTASVAG